MRRRISSVRYEFEETEAEFFLITLRVQKKFMWKVKKVFSFFCGGYYFIDEKKMFTIRNMITSETKFTHWVLIEQK
jgi:hypothetical protein